LARSANSRDLEAGDPLVPLAAAFHVSHRQLDVMEPCCPCRLFKGEQFDRPLKQGPDGHLIMPLSSGPSDEFMTNRQLASA
jgi:hypothetical protein